MRNVASVAKGIANLNARIGTSKGAQVGYTASYAWPVHQNRAAVHKIGKAGFLLDPYRENLPEYTRMLAALMRRGYTFGAAAMLVGLQLQRDSQRQCPVLTGALKGSAYTRPIEG